MSMLAVLGAVIVSGLVFISPPLVPSTLSYIAGLFIIVTVWLMALGLIFDSN
jgi:hypothetical protein